MQNSLLEEPQRSGRVWFTDLPSGKMQRYRRLWGCGLAGVCTWYYKDEYFLNLRDILHNQILDCIDIRRI